MWNRELPDLPASLKDLNVLSVSFKTNGLALWWSGFVDFSVQWHRVSNNEWQLSYVDEENGLNKTLYRRTMDEMANKPAHPSSQGSQGDR